jgi:hypothetical protein
MRTRLLQMYAIAAGLALLTQPPLDAQVEQGVRVTVDGREQHLTLPRATDNCTPATGAEPGDEEEIVVCRRRSPESPFRIPEALRDPGFDPAGPTPSVSRERNALTEPGSEDGLRQCSNVGPYGWTGCAFRDWRRKREQYGR